MSACPVPDDAMAAARWPEIAPLPRVETAIRHPNPVLWAIYAKPMSEWTAADWQYLEQVEQEGQAHG